MTRAIEYELGATATPSYAPTGFSCRFRFPARRALAAGSEAVPKRARASEITDVARRAGAVLVVEDDALIALETCELVETEGYAVAGPCATVEDALAVLERERPAFALLDVNLGGRNSFAVAERLIEMRVPFAFATGYERYLAIPVRYKDAPVLQKPTTPAAFRELLRRYVIGEAGKRQVDTADGRDAASCADAQSAAFPCRNSIYS